MKRGIHPTWYPQAKVTCACGASFTVGSTVPQIHVEICSTCHPFFTGEMRYIDTLGRVEKFQQRQKKATGKPQPKKDTAQSEKRKERPETLKEMVELIKRKRAEEKKLEEEQA